MFSCILMVAYLEGLTNRGILWLDYTPSKENPSDILTKSVTPIEQFCRMRDVINGSNPVLLCLRKSKMFCRKIPWFRTLLVLSSLWCHAHMARSTTYLEIWNFLLICSPVANLVLFASMFYVWLRVISRRLKWECWSRQHRASSKEPLKLIPISRFVSRFVFCEFSYPRAKIQVWLSLIGLFRYLVFSLI